MNYCVNPECQRPGNLSPAIFCSSCGTKLLLKERYRPVQPLGQGGFGRTFLAIDEDIPSKPHCVIKQLYIQHQDPTNRDKAIALFHQEAVRLDELGQHAQIPDLLAHFEQEHQFYLVQELIAGQTLAQELQQQGTFKEPQIWQLLQELLPVLQFVHAHQVIHRDIKPANIIRRTSDLVKPHELQVGILGASGGPKTLGQLVLIDFGIAKLITGAIAWQTGTVIGSPEYMAPEQIRGKAIPASDLYSLGVTCIQLLTNLSPFDLFDTANDCWVWRNCLPKGTLISDRLGQVLDKLLHNAVSQRYQSAREVLSALTSSTHATVLQRSQTVAQSLSPSAQPTAADLRSETGVDYVKLQDLLATGKWQEADHETWIVLCKSLSKPLGSYLSTGDIERLSCSDLQIIDQLWLQYSHGHFGFSVQAQIYQATGEDYGSFCDRLGWRPYNSMDTSYLKFSPLAPVGHLPSRRWVGGYHWWRHAAAMAAKLEHCCTKSSGLPKAGLNRPAPPA